MTSVEDKTPTIVVDLSRKRRTSMGSASEQPPSRRRLIHHTTPSESPRWAPDNNQASAVLYGDTDITLRTRGTLEQAGTNACSSKTRRIPSQESAEPVTQPLSLPRAHSNRRSRTFSRSQTHRRKQRAPKSTKLYKNVEALPRHATWTSDTIPLLRDGQSTHSE